VVRDAVPSPVALRPRGLPEGDPVELTRAVRARSELVDLEGPGARGDDAPALEVLDLEEGVVPVAADDPALLSQEVDRRLELLIVELVRILDPELGPVVLQVERRVSDVDRPVVGLDAAGVRGAVGPTGP
jgi:hypothetical protein